MKKLILLIFVANFFFACDKDDDSPPSTMQTWVLTKMTQAVSGIETTGNDMAWQEQYQFFGDGTFTKTRTQAGETLSFSGTYSSQLLTNVQINCVYPEENPILARCLENPTEVLVFEEENKLVGTFRFCGGPGLEYIKQ